MEYHPQQESQKPQDYPLQLANQLCDFAPVEVLALHDYVERRYDEQRERPLTEDEGFVYLHIGSALELLPTVNVAFAREVYTTYARSLDSIYRGLVAEHKLPSLAQVDHDFALGLWNQLIRDHDASVRSCAHDAFGEYQKAIAEGSQEAAEAALAELGLTWFEADQLLNAYADAEQGYRTFDLGEVALRRLVDSTR